MKCKPTLIIHGGAGNLSRSSIPPPLYDQYHASLLAYLRETRALLNSGSSALDAAVHAVSLLEDDELFNCARGSVFTSAGTIEMEASVMVTSLDGCETRSDSIHKSKDIDIDTDMDTAGIPNPTPNPHPGSIKRGVGVIGLRNVRHPIQLAREVLLRNGLHNDADGNRDGGGDGGTMHAQLSAPHVEHLARKWGLEFQPDEYFWTKRRWDEHLRTMKMRREKSAHSLYNADLETQGNDTTLNLDLDSNHDLDLDSDIDLDLNSLPQGTVGCVCLDQYGNLAVATSTGGMTNKVPGRVGDTPTLGAGFWAERWSEPYSELNICDFPRGSSASERVRMEEDEGGISMRWRDCLPLFLRGRGSFSLGVRGYSRGRRGDDATDRDTETQRDRCSSSTFTSTSTSTRTSEPGTQTQPLLENQNEKHPIVSSTSTFPPTNPPTKTKTTALALSGTGNGDSFLRTCAARTACAMTRFAPSTPLSRAVSAVAGPGGELQRSAGNRWGSGSGEGEGGIIGIEATVLDSGPGGMDMGMNMNERGLVGSGSVVFDFNCGGMWRAWLEGDGRGGDVERVMVFRESYY